MVFWFFEHTPTLVDLPEMVLSFVAASYPWERLLLALLRDARAQCSCFLLAQEFRLPDTLILCPWPNRLLA